MLSNVLISTVFYTLMLGIGHMLCFIDPIIYETIPFYVLTLLLVMRLYKENCKALEWRDFIVCALFVGVCLFYYQIRGLEINGDITSFLYLAVFLPFIGYASSIRYKSLM